MTAFFESVWAEVAAFFQKHGSDILNYTGQHIYLVLVALAIAILIALPTGILLAKSRMPRLSSVIMGGASVIQTVPTLAMIAIVVLAFLTLQRVLWSLWGLEWRALSTVGAGPALTALFLYALLPILRNTYTGIRQVDASVIEVATGMGMTRRQVLFQVELPLALPFIMAGLRIATVWTIGIATLCALIGAGGLGVPILQGLRNNKWDYLIAGTVPAAILALIFDGALGLLERWLTPSGMQSEETPA